MSRCRAEPGSRCRCTSCIVVYVAIPGGEKSCIFPGPTVSVETALIRLPKTCSSSGELVACRETGPRDVEPAKANFGSNAGKCFRKCSLFVRLPSPETSRPRIGRETQLLERILKGPRLKTPGYGCCYQIRVRRFLIGRTVLRGFPSIAGISRSVGELCRTRSTSGSPENRPGLRLRGSLRANGRSQPQRSGLRAPASGLRAPASSPFDPEEFTGFTPGPAPPS